MKKDFGASILAQINSTSSIETHRTEIREIFFLFFSKAVTISAIFHYVKAWA